MKVFLSWSGDSSRAVAEALRDWLPLVLHYVEPWMSEVDIDAGDRWADSVASELEASNFGIICVTRENASSPWILFEAGALAKSLKGSKVIPLLFDLDFRDVSGPLAQFQAKKLEKTGVGEVVQSINQAAEKSNDQGRAGQLFEALWPQFETAIRGISTDGEPAKRARPQGEVLEELVASVRTLDGRVREMPAMGEGGRRRGPAQMEISSDLALSSMEGSDDPVSLLAAAAAFKDSVPWLFELGMEAYRSTVSDAESAGRAIHRFLSGVEVVRRSPLPWTQFDIEPDKLSLLLKEVEKLSAVTPPVEPDHRADEIAVADGVTG